MKYTLKEHGFEVIENVLPEAFFEPINEAFLKDLEDASEAENIFMTEFGPKQIQHLERRYWFKIFAERLKAIMNVKGEILNMQVFIKYPDYKITYPHQDGAYFDVSNKQIITFWVPIQDVDDINSCMYYVPTSHINGLIEHVPVGSVVRTRSGKTGQSLGCDKYKLDEFISVPMKKGDVLIHDQFCVHYSSSNKTDKKRIALTCVLDISDK